jgi:hypothetical protein
MSTDRSRPAEASPELRRGPTRLRVDLIPRPEVDLGAHCPPSRAAISRRTAMACSKSGSSNLSRISSTAARSRPRLLDFRLDLKGKIPQIASFAAKRFAACCLNSRSVRSYLGAEFGQQLVGSIVVDLDLACPRKLIVPATVPNLTYLSAIWPSCSGVNGFRRAIGENDSADRSSGNGPRNGPTARACLDVNKGISFGSSLPVSRGFDHPLFAAKAIYRCPSWSEARSWPGNRRNLANFE